METGSSVRLETPLIQIICKVKRCAECVDFVLALLFIEQSNSDVIVWCFNKETPALVLANDSYVIVLAVVLEITFLQSKPDKRMLTPLQIRLPQSFRIFESVRYGPSLASKDGEADVTELSVHLHPSVVVSIRRYNGISQKLTTSVSL